jgi:hypothetical protein
MYRRFRDNNGDIHFLIQGEPQEDWVEVFVDETMLPDPNYIPPYDARRQVQYPIIANQLDMLWHELNQSGSLSTNGEWFNTIKEVKENNPKP